MGYSYFAPISLPLLHRLVSDRRHLVDPKVAKMHLRAALRHRERMTERAVFGGAASNSYP